MGGPKSLQREGQKRYEPCLRGVLHSYTKFEKRMVRKGLSHAEGGHKMFRGSFNLRRLKF